MRVFRVLTDVIQTLETRMLLALSGKSGVERI